MKAKILILDTNAILPKSFNSHMHHARRNLQTTIQTQYAREACAKAQLERPDFIFFISQGEGYTSSFQAFKAELSRHYLTQDIPLIHWSPSAKPYGARVSLHEAKNPSPQTGSASSISEGPEDFTPLDLASADGPTLLKLICEEFEEKLNAIHEREETPPPPSQ